MRAACRASFRFAAALFAAAVLACGPAHARPAAASPAPVSSASATVIHLSPATGPPGTVVRVSGYRPGGPTAAEAAQNAGLGSATLCWGPCASSLTFSVQIRWSATRPGDFSTTFTVPSVPWLTLGGPHAVTPGRYAIGLQCLAPVEPGCGLHAADAASTFTLTPGRTAPTRCQAAKTCAWLRLTPDGGTPGTVVRLSGWAPLTPVVGQPFGYEVWITGLPAREGGAAMLAQARQAPDGSLSGSFTIPAGIPGAGTLAPGRYTVQLRYFFDGAVGSTAPAGAAARLQALARATVRLAPATLVLKPAATWASLGRLRPLSIARNGSLMAQDARHPARLAYCAPAGGIELSADGGASWSAVSTAGVAAALRGSPYTLFAQADGGRTAACTGVSLDPTHPGSLYATFTAALTRYGAPPIFTLGLWTSDAGRTWHLVPPPTGYSLGDFGGFQSSGGSVLALFARAGGASWTAERARGGGASWTAARLPCPAVGPCLRFGAAPNALGSCAMNGAPQPLLASIDAGRRWGLVPGVAPDACSLAELVALGPREVALVTDGSGGGQPLRLSTDGGATWRDVALPPLPGQAGQYPQTMSGLQMLPDGALWTSTEIETEKGQGFVRQALLLAPGARAWCVLSGTPPAGNPDDAQVLAGRLWSFATGGAAAAHAAAAPLRALACAGGG